MNLFFGRISKDEIDSEELKKFKTLNAYLKFKWKQQERAVKNKFNIEKFDKCFYDHGSAYKEDEFKKRKEFHKLLEFLFDYANISVKDLFFNNVKKKLDINLYVFDFNRFSRKLEDSLLFYILKDKFGIRIFSYNQDYVISKPNERMAEKTVRYILLTVISADNEQYSDAISNNTKKAVIKDDLITISSDEENPKIWGKGFKRTDGTKLSIEETRQLKTYILNQIKKFESEKKRRYYSLITDKVLKKFNIIIGKSVLTAIKKGHYG